MVNVNVANVNMAEKGVIFLNKNVNGLVTQKTFFTLKKMNH